MVEDDSASDDGRRAALGPTLAKSPLIIPGGRGPRAMTSPAPTNPDLASPSAVRGTDSLRCSGQSCLSGHRAGLVGQCHWRDRARRAVMVADIRRDTPPAVAR